METPVVFQYQQALDRFRRDGGETPLLKRMSELISLLDLTSTLASSLSNEEILDAALLIVMGELQARRGALLVRAEDGRHVVRAARGLPPGAPRDIPPGALGEQAELLTRAGASGGVLEALGLELLCPVFKAGRAIAWLGLGPRADGADYGAEPRAFLRSVAACAATPIENGLIYHELKCVNERLSLKVYQLHGLFDVSRELTAAQDDASVTNLVTATLMGQLMVTRCGLYLLGPDGLVPVHERGLRSGEGAFGLPPAEAAELLRDLHSARPVAELPPGTLRERLERQRLALVVPLFAGGAVRGLLALGARASGAPFSDEDGDFAMTLGRQALAALESVRLQRMRLDKERQDRELQIAREIQRSLFPSRRPALPGFGVAAESRSCYQVGGDLYDFVALPGGRLALTVADVSGKGTPASILMASVHAWLQALAGTVEPPELMQRLNRFLFESTQAHKYVTLFYAELDPATRGLRYVNAGHVPPYHLRRDGRLARLECGGPVLGLLPGVAFEAGEARLEPGDVVAVVTDGATEALSPDDEEFGDERIVELLHGCAGDGAEEVLASLFDRVTAWTGAAGCSDDLTALVIKAAG
jgi:sigma-B regulation protein RsbU (phosphoserine phosphatase)